METIGNINIDELEALKKTLRGVGYKVTNDALAMIEKLESTIVTMSLNHNQYVHWAVDEMRKLEKRNA